MLRMHGRRALAGLLLVATATAQAFPPIGSDPQGCVLDEQLLPVPNATVSLVWEQRAPFGRAIAARLATSPLAATRSGRDGTFVLPLTQEQRQMGAVAPLAGGCWLVVEKEGYHAWREPIPAGLPSYLGSRVLLRRVREGDPFADLPWPPAIVSWRTGRGSAPWQPLEGWQPVASRRGGPAGGAGLAPVERTALGTVEIEVVTERAIVPRAQLWFEDGAFAVPAAAGPLPMAADDSGKVRAKLPAGKWSLRVTAPDFVPVTTTIDVIAGGTTRPEVTMHKAKLVDVLTATADGVPVPFVKLEVVPGARSKERSRFHVLTDSVGRARLPVVDPEDWVAIADDAAADRVPLGKPGADGLVRVVKYRPVTIMLRGDEWPQRGTLRWERAGLPAVEDTFVWSGRDAQYVVTRLCHREDDEMHVAGISNSPFRIRRQDLPPMTTEVLLDLAVLDRRLRPRATLDVTPAGVGRLRVSPLWQGEDARLGRAAAQCARTVGGAWQVVARDDGPLELVATGARLMMSLPVRVPELLPDAPLPRLPVNLTSR